MEIQNCASRPKRSVCSSHLDHPRDSLTFVIAPQIHTADCPTENLPSLAMSVQRKHATQKLLRDGYACERLNAKEAVSHLRELPGKCHFKKGMRGEHSPCAKGLEVPRKARLARVKSAGFAPAMIVRSRSSVSLRGEESVRAGLAKRVQL
eukprot:4152828-Pleurochrysis_carterae.AAC.1